MIRIIAPVVLVLLILGGLVYWRYNGTKSNLTTPSTTQEQIAQQTPIEVPKTLPEASLEDRVKALEDVNTKLVTEVNRLKSQSSTSQSSSSTTSLSTSVTELKARVSALESKSSSTTSTSGGATSYIPLGSGGVYTNTDWVSLSEYEVSLDPANFPGYSGMVLEATFRLDDPSGTASVRLYNVTDGSAISSQLDSTSTSYSLKTSSSFKLATGTKTYRLQVKSTSAKNLFLQTARLKVTY